MFCVVRQSQMFVEVVPFEKDAIYLGQASVRLRDKAIWVAQSSPLTSFTTSRARAALVEGSLNPT